MVYGVQLVHLATDVVALVVCKYINGNYCEILNSKILVATVYVLTDNKSNNVSG